MNRAIIIDNDVSSRQVLKGILANEGFEVVETIDGQKGITAVRSHEDVGVIFLADRLTGLSGLDTLIAIRKFQPKVPVLMLIENENRQAAQRALSRGAAWFLNKPVKVEDVLVVTRHLMEKRHLQETIDQQISRLQLLEKQTSELTHIEDDDLPPEEVLKESDFLSRSIELISEVLDAKKVSLMLLSRDGKELVMAKSNWILPSKIPNIRQLIDQGVAGQVVREGVALLVTDAARDTKDLTNEFTRQYESSSFIVTPLLCGRKVIGVISANDKRNKKPFTEGDLAILNTFANQMSMAVANVFMMKRTEREKLKLRFINGIVETLVSSIDPGQIYKSLLEKVMIGLRATCGILAFSDPGGQKILIEHVAPEDHVRKPDSPVLVGNGVFFSVLQEGHAVIRNTTGEDSGVDMAADFPAGITPGNIAVTPLLSGDTVLGLLAVYNKQENLPFDDWDREILEAVSPPASMAIKQAWLYQNLIKSIDEVVETNKQLEDANAEVRQKVKELNWLKSKVAT
ncbi:MAG: GAF domain-containing protein [bacterium]|nr:GAF domain-containing protein [bacterium]MDT8366848.1 GAF domain-containing protein [bacterium]